MKKTIVPLIFIPLLLLLVSCGAAPQKEETTPPPPQEIRQDEINEVDYSSYFNGLNGSAVFFTPADHRYDIYNASDANDLRSPCSTFKIISSLLALENGVIDEANSVRPWSGEIFWNKDWNRDMDFPSAFKTSCVWYFRQVIDDLDQSLVQEGLRQLDYGNQDISDWSGSLNPNNSNPALIGFWIESSLKISPKQQTEVMSRIFEPGSDYSSETLQQLKAVMVADQNSCTNPIYGKTGSGKQNNQWVDAWFVGFIERNSGNTYFAVHLANTKGAEISSPKARDIALQIAADFYDES